jgi:endonuclease YncB( thermonuclease family)
VIARGAIAILAALACTSPAAARWYAIDGDTIKDTATRDRARLENVDTPELHGARCPAERALAERARDFTAAALRGDFFIRDIGRRDRYGRRLVRVLIPGRGDLGDLLIAAGLGRPYHGERRAPWC